MRRLLFVSLLAALAAVAQLPRPVAISPRRISATEIRKDGGVTHYRGNVAFRTGGLDIHGEELDYLAGEWQFRTRGGARASLARPVAEYVGDPLDVSRFEADGIRRDGETLTLHGNARLRLPNWVVSAEDAVVDRASGTVSIKGDAVFVALKSYVTDDLGPMFLTSASPGAVEGESSAHAGR